MAVDLTDQVQAVSKRYFLPKLADNIYVGTPALKRLKDKGLKSVNGGTSIVVPLEYAQGNSQWFLGAETITTTDANTFQAAEYSWKQLAAPIVISRLDELKNMGDAQVVDFVRAKMKSAQKTLSDDLDVGIFNAGSTSNEIVGLRAIVGTGNTIGGIGQTANSWWQGQVDSATTTLGLTALETNYMNCSEDSEAPTVGYTTKALFAKYWGLLQPQQRFASESEASAGFKSLLFNGIPVIAASNCPSAHWFFVNEEYLHLFVHSSENMRMDEFERPRNQAVKVAHVFWAGALGSSNNRYHGKFSALAA
jgi:hypothetical protein